jgi:hypothetical protein
MKIRSKAMPFLNTSLQGSVPAIHTLLDTKWITGIFLEKPVMTKERLG